MSTNAAKRRIDRVSRTDSPWCLVGSRVIARPAAGPGGQTHILEGIALAQEWWTEVSVTLSRCSDFMGQAVGYLATR